MEISENTSTNNLKRELEGAIINGPFLFGWIWGILMYPAKSYPFKISFQMAIFSFSYLLIYGIAYGMFIFIDFPSDYVLNYFFSLISFAYILLSAFSYFYYRKGELIPGFQFIHSFLDRVIQEEK